MNTTQARLIKLALASRDTFLYRQSGITTQMVTTNTTIKRTVSIEMSHAGRKRINTFDSVSPTTTLYDIIAANDKDETILVTKFLHKCKKHFYSANHQSIRPSVTSKHLSLLRISAYADWIVGPSLSTKCTRIYYT